MTTALDKPPTAYEKRKERERRRMAVQAASGMDIGDIPPVESPRRRASGGRNLRLFCETYLPAIFYRAWSDDHLRVIGRMERVILRGERYALAMPRGNGKTVLTFAAALWAVLYGHRRFVVVVAANGNRAQELLEAIKTMAETNPLLLADFPEAIYPIRALGRIVNRQKGQRYRGEPTRIEWSTGKVVFPTIPGSPASGAVVAAAGLKGSDIRGQTHTLPTGQILRPDLAIVDDPQTGESAWSNAECEKRERLISQDVLGMAGPGEYLAAVMPCTVNRDGDVADNLLDRDKHPEWHGERYKLLYAWPERMDLWEKYAEIRATELKNDGDGSQALAFYLEHRNAMDAGARPAWPERYIESQNEASALQHAMNLYFENPEGFAAEYQNEPQPEAEADTIALNADQIAAQVNEYKRGRVPTGARWLTASIDVHDKLLYWTVTAWAPDFTGWVVDYGTYPDQPRKYFTMRAARRTLRRMHQGIGQEEAIRLGLLALIEDLQGREWKREDGAVQPLDLTLIDRGHKPEIVDAVAKHFGRGVMPSFGQSIRAAHKPLSEYTQKPGQVIGHHWWIPPAKKRWAVRYVRGDTNYWKSFIHARLGTGLADPASLSLFGKRAAEHRLFAEHLTAETPTRTQGRERTVDEWKERPAKPDNHWFDAIVGTAVAASMLGASLAAEGGGAPKRKPKRKRKRKRVTYL